MDYWLCVSVCLCVSVISRERHNVQMLRASLSESLVSFGDLPHSAVSSAYRTFEIDLPPITAPDSVISASLITCSV